MSASAPRITLDLPMIPIDGVAATERNGVDRLNRELETLKQCADDFCDAWLLFDFIHHNSQQAKEDFAEIFPKWKLLAARDGAMTIYRFAKALEIATGLLSHCQTVLADVDRTRLRSARQNLAALLPEFESVRDAVIQAAAHMNDLDSVGRSSRLEHSDGELRDALRGRKYQSTFDGKLQIYRINRQTYEGLIAVANEFYSAFGKHYHQEIPSDRSSQRIQNFVWRVRPDFPN